VLKEVRYLSAHFKSGTSIQHLTEAPSLQKISFTLLLWWEELLIKLTVAAGYKMDVSDLKYALKRRICSRNPDSRNLLPFLPRFVIIKSAFNYTSVSTRVQSFRDGPD
jgi:hypothetical protein